MIKDIIIHIEKALMPNYLGSPHETRTLRPIERR